MTKASILIVDDDDNMRDFLAACLKEEGYQAHAAENASEAQKYLGHKIPDLILLDMMMPDMNGIELCRWMQEQEPPLCRVPVIGVSGVRDDSIIEDAMAVGAVDYIIKPFSIEDLTKKVEVALGRTHRRKA